MQALLNFGMRR